VILGNARTMQQDIDFGLRQLNDIALRALSPAVNDATTASEVVLRIGSIMRPLVQADLPGHSVRATRGRILLTPIDLDHGEYIGHAFDQLRLYAAPILRCWWRSRARCACSAAPASWSVARRRSSRLWTNNWRSPWRAAPPECFPKTAPGRIRRCPVIRAGGNQNSATVRRGAQVTSTRGSGHRRAQPARH
jgi:hypothetical protein